MNFCRSTGLFRYSTILLFTLLFNEEIAADRCIYDPKIILTDLINGGKNLLNFNFARNSDTVLTRVMALINGRNVTIDDILAMLGSDLFAVVVNRSTDFIKNIKSENNRGKNPCEEVLRFCDLGISVEPNTYVVQTNVITWNRGLFISPVYLTEEPINVVLSTIHHYITEIKKREANMPGQGANVRNQLSEIMDTDRDASENEYVEQIFSELILAFTTLQQCEVKKSDTGETTSEFYMFTLMENGYPRFIIQPLIISGVRLTYISSELLPENGASSSTPNAKEEELEEESEEELEEESEEELEE